MTWPAGLISAISSSISNNCILIHRECNYDWNKQYRIAENAFKASTALSWTYPARVAEFFGFVIEHPTKLLPASKQQFPLSQASPCMHQINLAYIIMCVCNNVHMCCTKYSWQSHDYIYGHYVLFAIGCINSNSGPYTYCTQPTCKIQLQVFGSLATTAHYNNRHVGRGK